MVERSLYLDSAFGSLADPTRRSILEQLIGGELSISEVAAAYNLSFAAIAKHITVLEKAHLVVKHRRGKEQMVQVSPQALADIDSYLAQYRQLWDQRLDALDALLKREQ